MTTPSSSPGDRRRDLPGLLVPLDAGAGPARRLPAAVAAEMARSVVETALDGADGADGVWPARRTTPRWIRRLGLAAALVAISASTGAGAVASRLIHLEGLDPEPGPAAPVAPPAPAARPAPAPVPAPPQLAVPPAAPAAPEPPPAPARRVRRRAARPIAVEAAPVRWAPEPPPIAAAAAPAPVVVPENLPPADLLASANGLRERRAWRDADQFYRAVASRFGGTDAAVVAEVASAGLHVQHLGDAAGALHAFRRTLAARPSGPLAEEARWGIAEAQRALGDAPAEARALRELLEHHPTSALAPAARHRLSRIVR